MSYPTTNNNTSLPMNDTGAILPPPTPTTVQQQVIIVATHNAIALAVVTLSQRLDNDSSLTDSQANLALMNADYQTSISNTWNHKIAQFLETKWDALSPEDQAAWNTLADPTSGPYDIAQASNVLKKDGFDLSGYYTLSDDPNVHTGYRWAQDQVKTMENTGVNDMSLAKNQEIVNQMQTEMNFHSTQAGNTTQQASNAMNGTLSDMKTDIEDLAPTATEVGTFTSQWLLSKS